jgi:hypothetical protein
LSRGQKSRANNPFHRENARTFGIGSSFILLLVVLSYGRDRRIANVAFLLAADQASAVENCGDPRIRSACMGLYSGHAA